MMTLQNVKDMKHKFELQVVAMVITRPELTMEQIAEKFGVKLTHVKYIMRKHKVAPRPKGRWKGSKDKAQRKPKGISTT